MQPLRQTIADYEHAISSFADYLELWANYDVKPQYQEMYSREFVAFMLLKARGELKRYTDVLEASREHEIDALLATNAELEGIFRERVVEVSGGEVRDLLLKTLDCEALLPDMNEYLGLYDYYSTDSRRGVEDTYMQEIGCNLILKRDELQLVMEEIETLLTAEPTSASAHNTFEEKRAKLESIDTVIRLNAPAFEPLGHFLLGFRGALTEAGLNRQKYWWWFLDEPLPSPLPAAESLLTPEQQKMEAQEMADIADAIGGNGGGWQHASQLAQIGELAYHQLVSSERSADLQQLASFAHGALNQAVILLGERSDSAEYARACYALSLVCRYISRWTHDPEIARKSLSLLRLASSRLSGEELAAIGLGALSERQAEALIDDLRERRPDAIEKPGLVSAEATVPVLNPVDMLVWLHATYGVEPQRQRALWDRIRAILDRGLPVPEPFMRPRLMGAMGSGETPSDDEDEEELADLRPGILGRLYWPCRARKLVRLDLNIEDRDRLGLVPDQPIQIALWANVLPPDLPEGLAWADWILSAHRYNPEIKAHETRFEIPISQPCRAVEEKGKMIIRRWICQDLTIGQPTQETAD